jgi:hypothetical protein
MRNEDFIPRSDAKFNVWVIAFFAYLMINLQKFNIVEDDVLSLLNLKEVWDVKFQIAKSPSTATPAAVIEKQEARKELEASMRKFIKEHLAYNHLVTDGDREGLGLPIYKTTHTAAPVPGTPPAGRVDIGVHQQHILHFFDAPTLGKAKPTGVHSCEIWWKKGGDPPQDEELVYLASDTRSPYTVNFSSTDVGKTVYYKLRWINTRDERGPWSELISAVIG